MIRVLGAWCLPTLSCSGPKWAPEPYKQRPSGIFAGSLLLPESRGLTCPGPADGCSQLFLPWRWVGVRTQNTWNADHGPLRQGGRHRRIGISLHRFRTLTVLSKGVSPVGCSRETKLLTRVWRNQDLGTVALGVAVRTRGRGNPVAESVVQSVRAEWGGEAPM